MSATRLTAILQEVADKVAKDFPTKRIVNASHNDWPGGKYIELTKKDSFGSTVTFEIFEMPTCCAIIVMANLSYGNTDTKVVIKVVEALQRACRAQNYTQVVYNESQGRQDKVLNDSGFLCRKPFTSHRTGSVIRTWLCMV